MDWVFEYQDLEMLALKYTNMNNFHSIQVVCRSSKTQPQVGENLNYLIQHLNG